jgi:hypothetical protein
MMCINLCSSCAPLRQHQDLSTLPLPHKHSQRERRLPSPILRTGISPSLQEQLHNACGAAEHCCLEHLPVHSGWEVECGKASLPTKITFGCVAWALYWSKARTISLWPCSTDICREVIPLCQERWNVSCKKKMRPVSANTSRQERGWVSWNLTNGEGRCVSLTRSCTC